MITISTISVILKNPSKRLDEKHNKGRVKSTKHYKPYKLCKQKKFDTKAEALNEEKRIKAMKSRIFIESLIDGDW